MKTETNRAIAAITRTGNAANATLDRWKEKLAADPANAFEWADAAFRAAATRRVVERLLALLGHGVTIADVVKELEAAVLSGARFPERSTSPSSNEMGRCVLQAQAELLNEIRGVA